MVNIYGRIIDTRTLRLVNEYAASSPANSDKVDSDVRGTLKTETNVLWFHANILCLECHLI